MVATSNLVLGAVPSPPLTVNLVDDDVLCS
jgi:hypothetical protein